MRCISSSVSSLSSKTNVIYRKKQKQLNENTFSGHQSTKTRPTKISTENFAMNFQFYFSHLRTKHEKNIFNSFFPFFWAGLSDAKEGAGAGENGNKCVINRRFLSLSIFGVCCWVYCSLPVSNGKSKKKQRQKQWANLSINRREKWFQRKASTLQEKWKFLLKKEISKQIKLHKLRQEMSTVKQGERASERALIPEPQCLSKRYIKFDSMFRLSLSLLADIL